jgi:ABC-2 type transport system ATP-binding protein
VNIIECARLGKRYGRSWALRDCSLAIASGHFVALVGPNGAGKTTLLQISVGLISPTEGTATVLGREPAGSPAALDRIAFVAQDAPLYRNLPVGDMLRMAANMNRRWDHQLARTRLAELGIPLGQKVASLSGGQQAQLALTIALARRPELLVLDEPLAMLDPLARHDFMASVLAAVAEDGLSVILSSHVLAELERVADYLILVSEGHVQVAGEVDDLLSRHRLLTGPAAEAAKQAERMNVVHARRGGSQSHLLVRGSAADPGPAGWESRPVSLEELVMAYLREPGIAALPGPTADRPSRATVNASKGVPA